MDMVIIGTQTAAGGGYAWLAPGPAASWTRMLATGMPAGGITEAGRTRERQIEVYNDFLAGRLQATAAKPGTSRHETGRAIDVQTASATQAWLIANAAEHGWTRPLLHAPKPEAWHWEHTTALDQHATSTITAPLIQEVLMAGAQLADFIGLIRCKTGAVVAINKASGKVKGVTPGAFQTIVNAGLVSGLYLDDGAGHDLQNMDEGPFHALVDLLTN